MSKRCPGGTLTCVASVQPEHWTPVQLGQVRRPSGPRVLLAFSRASFLPGAVRRACLEQSGGQVQPKSCVFMVTL